MDYASLAALLFPDIGGDVDQLEARFPPRDLPDGAKVTRIAPSPTGFMHLGNLFGAVTDERLAHQSGGVFILRIEDTDQKREVPGGVELIQKVFSDYRLPFDEGVFEDGDKGAYGPYRQRQRAQIYKTCVKWLVEQGKAYPCFCAEEEISAIREKQSANKENIGYYGSYAVCRKLTFDEIKQRVEAGQPFAMRFRSQGSPENKTKCSDLVKGLIEFPENDQDLVLLKSDGIPTYHFAHVVDDHFMRVTHIVRGEEWLATWPIHMQLFAAMGWKPPKFIHTAHLMKMDGNSKRKLSKRRDPELALDYYREQGYAIEALKEYVMTLLNSNFEEWRIANPGAHIDDFPFMTKKMGVSGALFDLDKLNDISKNVISRMDADEVYALLTEWAKDYDREFFGLLTRDPEYTRAILSIGRGVPKPRKDIAVWSGAKEYMSFFFDELFRPGFDWPDNICEAERDKILSSYSENFAISADGAQWFDGVKKLAASLGYADMKEYKKNPDAYPGHVGDVAMILRVAVTGRQNTPDLFEIIRLLGENRIKARLAKALKG